MDLDRLLRRAERIAGRGFVVDGLKLGLLTEADLLGRTSASGTRDMRKMPSRRRNAVDPLQLKEGDFVVHEQHGVAKFVELMQRSTGAGPTRTTREYLVLEYAPSKRGAPGDRGQGGGCAGGVRAPSRRGGRRGRAVRRPRGPCARRGGDRGRS